MGTTAVALSIISGAWFVLGRHFDPSHRFFSRLMALLTVAFYVRYVVWRTLFTLPDFSWPPFAAFAYLFYGVELLSAYITLRDQRSVWRWVKSERTGEVDRKLDWYGDNPPRVDVLIPTYDEPWSILERTIAGATAQNYRNYKVWILDDGRREWLRTKAEEQGVGYITRGSNADFKAGNLNHAVKRLRELGVALEFIAILDADCVARPQFLRRTLALMMDPKIAVVQTPQWYYNGDPFQQVFGGPRAWPDETRQWFDVIQPRLDSTDDALCGGTSCVLRVRALDDIGGFPVESLSEDTLCSVKLKKKGWTTRYLNERLSTGLAPEGIGEFLSQRARWQYGLLQISRLFPPSGLSARIHYWLSLWTRPIFALRSLGWFVVPVLYLFTGYWVLQRPIEEVVSYFLPLWALRVFYGWFTEGRRLLLVSDIHFLSQHFMTLHVTAATVLRGRSPAFNVTRKGVLRSGAVVHWGLLGWMLLFGISQVVGIVYALADFGGLAYERNLLLANIALSGYALLQVVGVVIPCFEHRRRRTYERFSTSEPAWIVDGTAEQEYRCGNLSLGGVLLETGGGHSLPATARIRFRATGAIPARLLRQDPTCAAYAFETASGRGELVAKLYGTDEYLTLPDEWKLGPALAGFVRGIVSLRR